MFICPLTNYTINENNNFFYITVDEITKKIELDKQNYNID